MSTSSTFSTAMVYIWFFKNKPHDLLSFAMQSPIVSSGPQALNGDTSVAPQRATLFQNAAGFEIVGGQFVLGDLHNHIVPPPRGSRRANVDWARDARRRVVHRLYHGRTRETAHGRAWHGQEGRTRDGRRPVVDAYATSSPSSASYGPGPSTSSAPGNRSRTLTTPDYNSESDNYCSQLLRQGRGFPLYVPGPAGNLPEEYRRNGVSVGDVGTVTPEGVFDFFFNIYLASDHPINEQVPDDFSPLSPYAPKDILPLDFDPGNYVSTPSVQDLESDSATEQFPGGDFRFGCLGPKGAVLSLPHGSKINKLRNLEGVRRYVACHADNWYKFVNGPRGRGIGNGSLYLITGWEKCASWGMASFQAVPDEGQFQLSFKPSAGADAGYKYRWQRGNPARRKQADAATGAASPINQTVFIHGFTISLCTSIWRRLFGDVEICQLADPQSPKQSGQFVPYGFQQSLFSWVTGFFGGGGATGKKHCAERDDHAVMISDFPPTSTIFHPSRLLNDYLLCQAPEAKVAITHDDDWLDIFRDDGTFRMQDSVANQISDKLLVKVEHGAAFFWPKSQSTFSPTKLVALPLELKYVEGIESPDVAMLPAPLLQRTGSFGESPSPASLQNENQSKEALESRRSPQLSFPSLLAREESPESIFTLEREGAIEALKPPHTLK
ncbi:hypothetical protein C8J57DRAFT_566593 [Mycena rebaudengoi]|nr:hypothetical protein C8J57DRAFT_566593 [Mycena rebaudengoi]